MDNEENVLNLNEDADYMNGDELMNENSDENWDLKSKIIDFYVFPPHHTGGAIAMKIVELLKEWGDKEESLQCHCG